MPTVNPSEARARIVALLGDTVLQALELKDLLEDERRALQEQDVGAIEASIDRKSDSVERLHVLDRSRQNLCESWGFGSGPEQMQQCMDWCDEAETINSRWQELLQIAADGSTLNMTNGAIIRVRQQHFESSLSVLRGVTPGSDTYGRGGAEASDFSSRSIAEA